MTPHHLTEYRRRRQGRDRRRRALTRTGPDADPRWLLVKVKDDEADARRNPISTEPDSVVSGRRTTADKLRHPRFIGLRADKDPEDVVRESPQ